MTRPYSTLKRDVRARCRARCAGRSNGRAALPKTHVAMLTLNTLHSWPAHDPAASERPRDDQARLPWSSRHRWHAIRCGTASWGSSTASSPGALLKQETGGPSWWLHHRPMRFLVRTCFDTNNAAFVFLCLDSGPRQDQLSLHLW